MPNVTVGTVQADLPDEPGPADPAATNPATTGPAVTDPAAGGGSAALAAPGPAGPTGSAAGKPAQPAATGPRPWRRALRAALITWVATRLGLAALTTIAWIGEMPHLTISNLVYKWATQFDSTWFIDIARRGYVPTADLSQAAFFPLYPALIHVLTPVTGGRGWLAALIIANLALLAALAVIYRLGEEEFGWSAANRTAFYLLAFPTGFFLTAAYNEGLFIALFLGSLYAIRHQRWWIAGGLGLLACATRSAGLLLVLPFGYEYLRTYGRRILRPSVLAVGLVPLGLLPVMIATTVTMHSPLAFLHAQARHWGRHLNYPWIPIYESLHNMVRPDPYHGGFGDVWVHNMLELGTTLMLLALVVLSFVGPWRVRRDQYVLPLTGLAEIIFMISFPSIFHKDIPYPLFSVSRIGLEAVPAFFILGRIGRNTFIDRLVLTAFLTMQGVLVARFLHGLWVA
jgi:Gpi18-like mannosyltransferase